MRNLDISLHTPQDTGAVLFSQRIGLGVRFFLGGLRVFYVYHPFRICLFSLLL
jgi:hypothetical protein